MTYQMPTLTFVGSATGLVLGTPFADLGPLSDNVTDIDRFLVKGNSRYVVVP